MFDLWQARFANTFAAVKSGDHSVIAQQPIVPMNTPYVQGAYAPGLHTSSVQRIDVVCLKGSRSTPYHFINFIGVSVIRYSPFFAKLIFKMLMILKWSMIFKWETHREASE